MVIGVWMGVAGHAAVSKEVGNSSNNRSTIMATKVASLIPRPLDGLGMRLENCNKVV